MVRLIRKEDIKRWKRAGKWTLVYGRRKTGKSFFVRHFIPWDRYFFVGRGGEVLEGDEQLPYDAFLHVALEGLKNGKTVVIDEIQRLPAQFHDRLHALGVTGELIAVSSTLWMAQKLLSKQSPLLGLFSEFKMGLIDERDVLSHLSLHIKDPKRLVELATYLREPWLLPFWEKGGEDCLLSMAADTKMTVPALIGEIFSEEQRQLSAVYEGILRAVADGKRVSGEIASSLFSRKVIGADNPSLVHPYLHTLHRLGILEKTPVFGKNRYTYAQVSPVLDLYYYLDEKYGFTERELPDPQIGRILQEKMPLHVEQFFGNLLSKLLGLGKTSLSGRDYEIDIALTDFKRLKVVGEVKWKHRLSKADIQRVEEVLGKFDCRRILIVPERSALPSEPTNIEVWDLAAILEKISSTDLPH